MRLSVINRIIRSRDYRKYLCIDAKGCQLFPQVEAEDKVGCGHGRSWYGDDPRISTLTSDEFFAAAPRGPFDVVFIDGDHNPDQVGRDIANSLRCLSPGGVLVLHDCNPPDEAHQVCPRAPDAACWTGQVWRPYLALRTDPRFDSFTVDADYGVGIVDTRQRFMIPLQLGGRDPMDEAQISFEEFFRHREEWLALVPMSEFEGRFPV